MNRAVGRSDSPPPENFLKPVCGISVVKRKITPVFTEVIFSLVDLKGIEPSNLTDANRALSQLSYRPKPAETGVFPDRQGIITHHCKKSNHRIAGIVSKDKIVVTNTPEEASFSFPP